MIVGLLRHGEVEGGPRFRGRTDDCLTGAGLAQMRAAAAGASSWDRIVTSPLRRCSAFACELAERQGIPLAHDPRLAEIDFGAWEGRTAAEILAEEPDPLTRFWRDPVRYPPPDGEPLAGFRSRVLAAWRDLVDPSPADGNARRILVVTHGGVIRILLSNVERLSPESLSKMVVPHAALYYVRIRTGSDGVAGSELLERQARA